jgi:hypothetical protein
LLARIPQAPPQMMRLGAVIRSRRWRRADRCCVSGVVTGSSGCG